MLAEVVIEGAIGSFDKRYSYAVPVAMQASLRPGCRVTVPFGRGNTKRQGLVLALRQEEPPSQKLKLLLTQTDAQPILNDEQLKLCAWLQERTFCSYFDAVHTLLPAGLLYRMTEYYAAVPEFCAARPLSPQQSALRDYLVQHGETARSVLEKAMGDIAEPLRELLALQAVVRRDTPVRRMGDQTNRYVRFIGDEDDLLHATLTDRQREIAGVMLEIGSCSLKELQYFTGVSTSVVHALEQKGLLACFDREVLRKATHFAPVSVRPEIVLTDEQQRAFQGLLQQLTAETAAVSLLYGVTGSGKTQIFLKLVDAAVDRGLGVIVMVPEIALTPQTLAIFGNRYGDRIAVLHSNMSMGTRMDEYKRIRSGQAQIAIGTRSAVFAPFEKLGLLIMDEEQEHTYKSEKSPRFHARDVAKFRANEHGALLCLASATPSMESYTAAKCGRYGLFTLKSRYGAAVLPTVQTVDMKREILSGNTGSISQPLYAALEQCLQNKQQAIILLNRRGHNTYITCPNCGSVATCPNCSISLTYHSANHRLMCHYCGYSEPESRTCLQCGGENVRYLGVGTQKIQEELAALFPAARLLRMDADSTLTRDAYADALTAFADGEYDIMIGTQMVAKGLDFPRVTLVGVLGADQAVYSEDYRSFERTFALLTQVVGRAGRGRQSGCAVIQSTDPSAAVVQLAVTQNYDAFYEAEMKTRKVMTFPPFCDIFVLCATSVNRECAEDTLREVADRLRTAVEGSFSDVKMIVLGPGVAAVPKINLRYRYRLTVKGKNNKRFRELLRLAMSIRLKRDATLTVDVNPETVI